MAVYWSILLWVFFGGLTRPKEINPLINDHAKGYTASLKLAIILMIPVTFFAAVRGRGISDTEVYVRIFNTVLPEQMDLFIEWVKIEKDSSLFYGLSGLWKIFVSNDAVWWLVLIATIQGVLLAITFRRYSTNVSMTVFIFMASTTFMWMYNGIRQFLVVAILFALTDCIIKNRWYIFIPVTLVLGGVEPILSMVNVDTPWWLGGMHQSALLMIPIFFFVQGKALNWKMLLMTAVFCLLAVTGALTPLLGAATEGTDLGTDLQFLAEQGDDGASPVRAVVAAAPLILALIKKKEIDAMGDTVPAIVPISINMTVFAVTLYAASTLTRSGIIIGRLPIYTEMYSYILIPWLFQNVYKNEQRVWTYCIYGTYLLWFIYQMHIAWSGFPYISDVLGVRV